jgi:DNA end-binding protein Ku
MAATWKGSLSFGLVSIPIQLSPAARTERISFNQLHKVCHSRLKQPLFCPTCNRNVERNEIEKGFEYEKDQYLLFNEDELEKIQPESARVMEILEFVKVDEIDPLYFDASYYATPEPAGAKGYRLLLDAMLKSGYAGIAKVTMHGREYIVIIRPRKGGLTIHTMFYSNEIRQPAEAGADKFEIKEQERSLASQLIETLAGTFEPGKYHDTYQEGLRTLIEAKAKDQDVIASVPVVQAAPADLMAALKQSLSQKQPQGEKKILLRVVPKDRSAAKSDPSAKGDQATSEIPKKSRRKVG